MSIRLEWHDDDTRLYSDNTLVARTEWGAMFLSIYVTDNDASITRYCVPGRIDTYTFTWLPSPCSGVGSHVAFFTDTNTSLDSALKRVRKDLKKKEVKQLLKEAKVKLGSRSHLASLLDALR